MQPAVFRNARYEAQFIRLAVLFAEQASQIDRLIVAVHELQAAVGTLGRVVKFQFDAEAHIPPLREIPRAFGMGKD